MRGSISFCPAIFADLFKIWRKMDKNALLVYASAPILPGTVDGDSGSVAGHAAKRMIGENVGE